MTSVSEDVSSVLREEISFLLSKGAGGSTREDGGRVLQPLLSTPKEAGACARFWIYGSLTSNSDDRSSKCLQYVIWFRDRFGTKHSHAVTSKGRKFSQSFLAGKASVFSYGVETARVYGLNNSSRLAGSCLYACIPEMGTEHWSECHTAFIQTSDDNASVCSSSGSLGISGLLSEGIPLARVTSCIVLTTDASLHGLSTEMEDSTERASYNASERDVNNKNHVRGIKCTLIRAARSVKPHD